MDTLSIQEISQLIEQTREQIRYLSERRDTAYQEQDFLKKLQDELLYRMNFIRPTINSSYSKVERGVEL